MRVKPDPTTANYEYRRNPRAALIAALEENHRANRRFLILDSFICIGAALAIPFAIVVSENLAGFLVLVCLLSGLAAIACAHESWALSDRQRGQWALAHIEERYVWKATDVRDKEGEVTANYLYIVSHAPKLGERVADPHALGKQKYISGPGVLVPEVLRLSSEFKPRGYVGRTVALATSPDGRVNVMVLVPECRLTRLKGPPAPAIR